MKRVLSGLTLIFVLNLVCIVAQATPIIVTNFSFETLPGSGLPNGACGTGCSWSDGAIPGWTRNSTDSGQFQPGTQAGNFAYFNTLSDGITSAYANNGSISQTVAPTVQLGVIYTLLVDLGHRNDTVFSSSADLLINGNRYAAIGTTPTSGNWSTFTATYTGLAADVGSAITIELATSGPQANFDNVRLSDNTVVPEPASLTALTLGLAGLLVKKIRRA